MIKLSLSNLMLCALSLQALARPNPIPKPRHQFIVIAHRGDHISYPENTLAAYAQAIKDGADYVEIDLRTTKDGKLVSLHNESVDRMTVGKGLVKDFTFDEIKKLKIAGRDSLKGEVYEIPSFEEILRLCKDKIYIYIDFKQADPALVYTILKQFSMEKQVLVYINSAEQFIQWRHAAPKMPLMLSLPDSTNNIAGMTSFINKYHPDVLDGNYSQYNSSMIKLALYYRIPVWPDAQSNTEGEPEWEQAIAMGLTGLQTDHPEALVNYLVKKGLRR